MLYMTKLVIIIEVYFMPASNATMVKYKKETFWLFIPVIYLRGEIFIYLVSLT